MTCAYCEILISAEWMLGFIGPVNCIAWIKHGDIDFMGTVLGAATRFCWLRVKPSRRFHLFTMYDIVPMWIKHVFIDFMGTVVQGFAGFESNTETPCKPT